MKCHILSLLLLTPLAIHRLMRLRGKELPREALLGNMKL